MRTIYHTLSIIAILLIHSCDIINPEEAIPSYIYVPDFQLNTNSNQGTNSNKITDVWVTVGDTYLGVYPLPALIPILGQGEQNITLEAGIKQNGINSTGVAYPFYQPFQTKVTLAPNEVDTLRPVITYRNNTKFILVENFDNNDHIFRTLRRGNEVNRIQIVSQNAFQGNSAQVTVNRDNPVAEISTVTRYKNPGSQGVSVYLEVNYKSEADVIFGIVGYRNGSADQPAFQAGFSARNDWNKIYFDLSPLLAGNTYDEYQVVFQTVLPSRNNVFTKDNATIWLDNIKLVHF
ncbi:MAG: hypothetical protein ACK4TA_22460 [Saprospiraceae bacterium]